MLNQIYNKNGYTAQVTADGTCVVHRVSEYRGAPMSTHCGEKLPSQDWREVQLHGVANEDRVQIVQAWREWAETFFKKL